MSVSKPSLSYSFPITWSLHRWGSGKYAPAPEYIVVHFTGGNGDNTLAVASVWTSMKTRKSNCHYIVGGTSIYECVDPHKKACTFACAPSKTQAKEWKAIGSNSLTCSHAKVAGNFNTINIETCSCKKDGHYATIANYGDPDWYFTDDTYKSLVKLCAWLCDEFGLGIDSLIMHHQTSGKICPAMWCQSEAALEGWYSFKKDVAAVLNDTPAPATGSTMGRDVDKSYTVKFIPGGTPIYNDPTSMIIVGYIGEGGKSNATVKLDRGGCCLIDEGWVPESSVEK